jgi:hypothetical protein
MADSISDDVAAGPKSVEVDGVKVEQHSLADAIAKDKYDAQKAAADAGHSGIQIKLLNPGGATRCP